MRVTHRLSGFYNMNHYNYRYESVAFVNNKYTITSLAFKDTSVRLCL